jgi:hypothetical protein
MPEKQYPSPALRATQVESCKVESEKVYKYMSYSEWLIFALALILVLVPCIECENGSEVKNRTPNLALALT